MPKLFQVVVLYVQETLKLVVDVTGNPPWNISYSVDGTVSTIISSDSPVIIHSTQEGTYTIPYVFR